MTKHLQVQMHLCWDSDSKFPIKYSGKSDSKNENKGDKFLSVSNS